MNKKLLVILSVLSLYAAAGTANATVFYIDEFTVIENGHIYWQDTFSDGVAPVDQSVQAPATVDVNLYDRGYLTRPLPGLPGPEANGKLAMDTAEGFYNIGVVNPVPNLIQRARVSSAMNTANASSLLASEGISVTGLFDLIEPELNNELYSIRVTDWHDDITPEGVELAVVKTGSGDWNVQLRQAIINDHWDPIQTWALDSIADIADYEQISLSLFNGEAGGNQFSAQFMLLDADGIFSTQTFTSSVQGLMYQYEDWLRPEFTTRVRVSQVPEPMTLLLFSFGLLGFALQRRKS